MSAMRRVSKKEPCPVCKKPDWCLIGTTVALCMRVQSTRISIMKDGSTGWFHMIDGSPLPQIQPKVEPHKHRQDMSAVVEDWRKTFGLTSLDHLSRTLGVTRQSLEILGCVKSPQHSVWGFPMMDAKRSTIGIRMRHENGNKWALIGSSNGLFIPSCAPSATMAICEGPTDTAAALTIGQFAIGKFNNCGGAQMIIDFIKLNKIRRVINIADCDQDRVSEAGKVANPGISGAIGLADLLPVPNCTLALPCKDMRAFVQSGGNANILNSLTSQLVWRQPKK